MKSRYVTALLYFGVILMIILWVGNAIQPGGRSLIRLTGEDTVAYFSTAHSLLFDHDFNLSNEFKAIGWEGKAFTAIQPTTGLPGSAFAIGYSLLEIPFLAAGTAVDRMAGHPSNGYSQDAIAFYFAGNIAFVTIGLVCLFLFLYEASSAWQTSEVRRRWTALLVTIVMWLSTTLAYYTFSPMSHAAGFMTLSLFLLVWWRTKDSDSPWKWALLGACGGLASLVRWQNILYILVPLLYDGLRWLTRKESAGKLSTWLVNRLAYGFSTFGCLIPQLLEWKSIYGKYLTIPQGEGFLEFPPRYVLQVLFSSQHGWFIWTPITLLGIAGLVSASFVWSSRKSIRIFLPWLVGLAMQIGVLGAQPTNWHGKESFGIRSLTCSLPVVALGLAWLLGIASRKWLGILISLVLLCSVFTFLFAIQYRLDLLPKNDRLTFSELITDKFQLRQAYQRHKVALSATDLIRNGRPAEAIEMIQRALRGGHSDRVLLRTLDAAQQAAGPRGDAGPLQSQLNRVLDNRLW